MNPDASKLFRMDMPRILFTILFLTIVIGVVFSTFSTASAQEQKYHEIINTFFLKIQGNKNTEAVDYIFKTNSNLLKTDQPGYQDINKALKHARSTFGSLANYEIVIDKKISSKFVFVYIVALYEAQPVKFEFQFIKPHDEWMVLNITISSNLDEDINLIKTNNLK